MTLPARIKARAQANLQSNLQEKAAELTPIINADQESIIRVLANELHRLNNTIMKAVEAGVSVELSRAARHHSGDGNWGDLLVPVILTHNQK